MAKYRKTLANAENQEVDFHNLTADTQHRYLIDKQIAMVDWQVKFTPGYLGALLSLVRHFPLRDMDELFSAVGRNSRKVMVLWGVHDKVCPYRHCSKVMEESFPTALNVDVLDCGHNCVLEKFEEVVTELLSFHREVFSDKKSLAINADIDD
jgi:pimeloyl-ACP methyl ester carboxylesterase